MELFTEKQSQNCSKVSITFTTFSQEKSHLMIRNTSVKHVTLSCRKDAFHAKLFVELGCLEKLEQILMAQRILFEKK